MIGPGTGLAPFRGFLQERAALRAGGRTVGPALLFFGCRHPRAGLHLCRASCAPSQSRAWCGYIACFSRVPDRARVYVQDEVLERQDEVWNLLQAGAVVYVCGDATRMAPDVRRAFAAMHRAKTGGGEGGGRGVAGRSRRAQPLPRGRVGVGLSTPDHEFVPGSYLMRQRVLR